MASNGSSDNGGGGGSQIKAIAKSSVHRICSGQVSADVTSCL